MNEFDVELELSKILQEEIWKELEKETGMSKKDLDNKILSDLSKLVEEKNG